MPILSNENDLKRLASGILVSDEKDTDAKKLLVELSAEYILEDAFKNVIDTNFDLIDLPFEIQTEIDELKEKVQFLEENNLDIQSDTQELLTEKSILQDQINISTENIQSLENQIQELNKRFSITPLEGTFISIPPTRALPKEKIEYWYIENGLRRRIINYCMLQIMMSRRDKSFAELQIFDASNIAKIKRGSDIPLSDFNDLSIQNAINNNLYVSDKFLRPGKLSMTLSADDWPPNGINWQNSFTIDDMMSWQGSIVQWGWMVGANKDILLSTNENIRVLLGEAAYWQAGREANPQILISEQSQATAVALNSQIQQDTVSELWRIRQFINQVYSPTAFLGVLIGFKSRINQALSKLNVALIKAQHNLKGNNGEPLDQNYIDELKKIFIGSQGSYLQEWLPYVTQTSFSPVSENSLILTNIELIKIEALV